MNGLFFVVALIFLFRAACFSYADLSQLPSDMLFMIQASEWSSFVVIVGLWWSHQAYKNNHKQ